MPKPTLKNPVLYKHITSQLYALHIDRECSIADISRATGIPAPTVARYLYGQPHGMTLHLLDALAKHFGTTVAELMEDVKGVRTSTYVIKRKLMQWVHGIQIVEV